MNTYILKFLLCLKFKSRIKLNIILIYFRLENLYKYKLLTDRNKSTVPNYTKVSFRDTLKVK